MLQPQTSNFSSYFTDIIDDDYPWARRRSIGDAHLPLLGHPTPVFGRPPRSLLGLAVPPVADVMQIVGDPVRLGDINEDRVDVTVVENRSYGGNQSGNSTTAASSAASQPSISNALPSLLSTVANRFGIVIPDSSLVPTSSGISGAFLSSARAFLTSASTSRYQRNPLHRMSHETLSSLETITICSLQLPSLASVEYSNSSTSSDLRLTGSGTGSVPSIGSFPMTGRGHTSGAHQGNSDNAQSSGSGQVESGNSPMGTDPIVSGNDQITSESNQMGSGSSQTTSATAPETPEHENV